MAYRFSTLAALHCALAVGASGCFNSPGNAPETTEGTTTGSTGSESGSGSSTGDTTSGVTTAGTSQTASTTFVVDASSSTGESTGIASSTGVESTCDDGSPDPGEMCLGPHLVILAGTPTAALALGDFDDDGNVDIAAGHESGLSVQFGSPQGVFAEGWTSEAEEPIGGILGLVALGSPPHDLLATAPDDDDLLLFNAAGNTDVFESSLRFSLAGGPYNVAVGRSGNSALIGVTQSQGSSVAVAQNVMMMPQLLQSGTGPRGIAIGRLDDGNNDDVVVANLGSNTLSVFLATGAPQPDFVAAPSLDAAENPRAVGIGDFDGDGLPDIVAVHEQGSAGFWYGDGTGDFSEMQSVQIGAGPRALAVADLDDDGLDDVAIALENGNAVGVLRGGRETELELFATMSSPTAIVAGDLNGDGAIDIATGSSGVGQGIAVILATP